MKFVQHFTNTLDTLDHAPILLKCMVSEHAFTDLVSLNKKTHPSLKLRVDKIMHGSGISTTRTNWNNECSKNVIL